MPRKRKACERTEVPWSGCVEEEEERRAEGERGAMTEQEQLRYRGEESEKKRRAMKRGRR